MTGKAQFPTGTWKEKQKLFGGVGGLQTMNGGQKKEKKQKKKKRAGIMGVLEGGVANRRDTSNKNKMLEVKEKIKNNVTASVFCLFLDLNA